MCATPDARLEEIWALTNHLRLQHQRQMERLQATRDQLSRHRDHLDRVRTSLRVELQELHCRRRDCRGTLAGGGDGADGAPGVRARTGLTRPDWEADRDADRLEEFRLTTRERDVARLIAQGHSNAGVATLLGISQHTARHHTESVLAKLGVRSRAQVGALLRGWLPDHRTASERTA
jgi:DNA-binding CsgD family transcriptional regulator